MRKFRTIYMVEVITVMGTLVARRYAANKRTAERIMKSYVGHSYIDCRKVQDYERDFINDRWVERF